MRTWLVIGLVAASRAASAYCPSYTASSQYNTYDCGIEAVPGTNPARAEWLDLFGRIAEGPAAWAGQGPPIAMLTAGCRLPTEPHPVPASVPCPLFQAIAWLESHWTQFCRPSTPADQLPDPERTIISFDCGYGAAQVTSGMHAGEMPAFDRARVAGDPFYNLATGASILAGKWNATSCVGDNQPGVIEDWYTAVWAYNGLTYSNNPNNPNLDPNRGVWQPALGGAYAYQEKVWGLIENPPDAMTWTAVSLAYPDRADVGTSGAPPKLPEPSCASPTDCTVRRSTHVGRCLTSSTPDLGADAGPSGVPDLLSPPDHEAPVMGGCQCHVGPPRRLPGGWLVGLVAVVALASRRRG